MENEMETMKPKSILLDKELKDYTDAELDVLKEKLNELTEQIIEMKRIRRKDKQSKLVKEFKEAFTNLREEGIEISVYRLGKGLIDNIDFDEFSFDDSEE